MEFEAAVPECSPELTAVLSSTSIVIQRVNSLATQYGNSVSGAGDVNGDGVPDLIDGAPDDNFIAGSGTGWRRVWLVG